MVALTRDTTQSSTVSLSQHDILLDSAIAQNHLSIGFKMQGSCAGSQGQRAPALILKQKIPRPSGLVSQRLLAEGAKGAPSAVKGPLQEKLKI